MCEKGAGKNMSQTDVFLVGHPVILESCSSLPINLDVLQDFMEDEMRVSLGRNRNRYEIAKETHEAVVYFWRKGNKNNNKQRNLNQSIVAMEKAA